MEEIIKKNIEKMFGNEKGGMLFLLSSESMGGNAGHWKGFPCKAANFHYNKSDGEIKFFGNIQNVPENIKQKFQSGYLLLALDIKNSWRYKIIKCFLDEATKKAKSNMADTIKLYNKEYGFN